MQTFGCRAHMRFYISTVSSDTGVSSATSFEAMTFLIEVPAPRNHGTSPTHDLVHLEVGGEDIGHEDKVRLNEASGGGGGGGRWRRRHVGGVTVGRLHRRRRDTTGAVGHRSRRLVHTVHPQKDIRVRGIRAPGDDVPHRRRRGSTRAVTSWGFHRSDMLRRKERFAVKGCCRRCRLHSDLVKGHTY